MKYTLNMSNKKQSQVKNKKLDKLAKLIKLNKLIKEVEQDTVKNLDKISKTPEIPTAWAESSDNLNFPNRLPWIHFT
ncbi:MAG: hypothetical protein Q7U04_14480 [Bacteriovorax sp.]|nr:hypothetical protein [Bacteriovorax sp.]